MLNLLIESGLGMKKNQKLHLIDELINQREEMTSIFPSPKSLPVYLSPFVE